MTRYRSFTPSTGTFIVVPKENEKSEPFSNRKQVRIFLFGGRGWIRTTEAEKQQIYSLSPLATREHAHIQFFAVTDYLYILPLGGVFVNCFLQLFQKKLTARLSRGDGHSGGLFWRNGGCGGS